MAKNSLPIVPTGIYSAADSAPSRSVKNCPAHGAMWVIKNFFWVSREAGQFFTNLEGAELATLYMPVGTIGRLFMAIEAQAFELAA